MESADRAARDGDERERKQLAGKDRSRSVDESRDCRHPERRQHQEYPQRKQENGADFHEGGEVVARAEEHPYRENAGDETIRDDPVGDGEPRGGEVGRRCRRLRDVPPAHQRQHQQSHSDKRRLERPAWPPDLHPEAHAGWRSEWCRGW